MASTQVQAASFNLYGDQSVVAASLAGAGSANPTDASTIFFNAAGMGFLPERLTITQGTSYIVPNIKYTDGGSVFTTGALNTPANLARLQGSGNGGNGGVPGKVFVGQSVPQLYIAYQVNDKFAIGFGANAPFGLETDWDPTSVLRYSATNSRITVANFSTVASYKFLPNLSIGAGIDVQYLQIGLSAAVDYGTINASVANGVVGGIQTNVPAAIVGAIPAAVPLAVRQSAAAAATAAAAQAAGGAIATTLGGINPAGRDGFVRFGGESIGVGFNVGIMWEPMKGTRLSASFRSNVEHDVEGNSRYTLVPTYQLVGGAVQTAVTNAVQASLTTSLTPVVGAAQAGAIGAGVGTAVGTNVGGSAGASGNALAARFVSQSIKAKTDLPYSASFGIAQDITPNLTLMADVLWTHWSSVSEIRILNTDGSIAALQPLAYKDVFRFSLGAQYKYGAWTFRAGYAYDNTPVNNSTDRTPRLPDNDRQTLAVGIGYQLTKHTRIDFAYDHLFLDRARIDTLDASGLHRNRGSFATHVDVFSLGTTMTFGPSKATPRPVYTK
ncbi:MAG: porin [Verrucomicrobia bacterium]|nr:porin [Verrucomicrobiota bacterium]